MIKKVKLMSSVFGTFFGSSVSANGVSNDAVTTNELACSKLSGITTNGITLNGHSEHQMKLLKNKQTILNKMSFCGLFITALLLSNGAAHAYDDDFVYPGTMCQGTSVHLGYSGPERTYSRYEAPATVTCPVPRHEGDGYNYAVTVYARDRNWHEDVECALESYTNNGDLYDANSVSSTGHSGNVEPFTTWVQTQDRGPIILRCSLPTRGGAGGSSITFYRVERSVIVK